MLHHCSSNDATVRPTWKFLTVGALLVLAGCWNSYGKSEYEQKKDREQDFADQVAAAGGSAKKEGRSMHGYQDAGWFIDLSGADVSDELVAAIVQAAQKDPVFQLNLSKSTVTDAQLAEFDKGKVLQKVFFLDLSDTQITDSGLDNLSNFYLIHELQVKGSKVTKDAVQRLGDRQLAKEQTPKAFKTRPKVDI